MITLILIVLALIALYCFGMWIFAAWRAYSQPATAYDLQQIELYTFHLGLCGVLAAGFIGLILAGGS